MPTVHFSGTYICHWQYFLRFLRYTNTGQFYCQKTFWNFWKIRRFLAIKLPSVGVSQKTQEILKLTYLCTRKIHSGHFRTYNQAIIEFLHLFLIFWALCSGYWICHSAACALLKIQKMYIHFFGKVIPIASNPKFNVLKIFKEWS